MTGIYRIEAGVNYPGVREYQKGSTLSPAGIYIESLIPGTELRPYRTREIKDSKLYRGYVLDGAIELTGHLIFVHPQKVDLNIVAQIIAEDASKNRGRTDLTPESFARLAITHGHAASEGGLRLLLPFKDDQYVVRLTPPSPQRPLYTPKPVGTP